MTTCNKLFKIEEIVKPILEKYELARNDDFYLYHKVVEEVKHDVERLSFYEVMVNHKELGLPNYESITRVRRKIQSKYPELASERVKKYRIEETEEYKKYAAM